MRFLKPALAAVLFVTALILSLPSNAQSYVIKGSMREWLDASGNVIGYAFKPCGSASVEYWGVRNGSATRYWSLDCGMINQNPDAPFGSPCYTTYIHLPYNGYPWTIITSCGLGITGGYDGYSPGF